MVVASSEQNVQRERLADLIGERLRKKWVAQEAGINPTVLSYLLSGKRAMTESYAERLAPVLGVAPWYLLGEDRE